MTGEVCPQAVARMIATLATTGRDQLRQLVAWVLDWAILLISRPLPQ